jgi:predicted nucleotidyltransferase
MNDFQIRLTEASKSGLPQPVVQVLSEFVAAAGAAFGSEDLVAAVLFGSAAEGRLRPTSDVNLLLVLRRFRAEAARAIESQLNFARAAVRLRVIFMLQSELEPAADLFAQKFNDIRNRHVVIYGEDPFAPIRITAESLRARTLQVLLNLEIRLRERLAANWSREDQLGAALAEAIGPVRSCAANVLELQGRPADSPKHALAVVVAGAPEPRWRELPAHYSKLREGGALEQGSLSGTLMDTMALIGWMYRQIAGNLEETSA